MATQINAAMANQSKHLSIGGDNKTGQKYDVIIKDASFYSLIFIKEISMKNINYVNEYQIKMAISKNILNTIKAWKNNIDIEKQSFHVVGGYGINKSHICQQIADELTKNTGTKFNIIVIDAACLVREDFILSLPTNRKLFRRLWSDLIPKDKNSYGLFVIDDSENINYSIRNCCDKFKMNVLFITIHSRKDGLL